MSDVGNLFWGVGGGAFRFTVVTPVHDFVYEQKADGFQIHTYGDHREDLDHRTTPITFL